MAELYVSFPGHKDAPIRALRGFQRISLAPGEKRQLSFDLSARDLSMVNAEGTRIVPAGELDFYVGGGQPGASGSGVTGKVMIQGERTLPD